MTQRAGMTLEGFVEKVVRLMEGAPPRALSDVFKVIADYERLPAPPTPADLAARLLAADQESGVSARFGRLLWSWDHVEGEAWTLETSPHSFARRARIYDLLEIQEELRRACDTRIPPIPMPAPVVIAEEHAAWYPPPGLDEFYWRAYSRHLREVGGWPEESLLSLDESTKGVVERLSDPTRPSAFQAKGLVVGYVQSGKTANFTGVIARAADAGYRLFIVLGGVLDILRSQTQRRIDKELIGKEMLERGGENEYRTDSEWASFIEHGGLPSTMGAFDWQRLTGAADDYQRLKRGLDALEFERHEPSLPFYDRRNLGRAKARMIVIKKNPTVMERLIRDLTALRGGLADVPALVIDDESDQASVNTLRQRSGEGRRRTSTNRQITRLLRILPRAQYVGYTATPFANVFVDPRDVEDIFPKDFVLSLARPAHYMGVSDFYDLAEDVPAGYRSNERAYVRSVTGEDSAAGNLQKAIDSFVLSGAIKLYREATRGMRFRHHTMLVHRSARRTAHDGDRLAVQRILDRSGYETSAGRARLVRLLEDDFRPVTEARCPGLALPAFSDLEQYVGRCLAKIEACKAVRVVNGEHQDDTPDFDRQGIWSILVGGAKLSRGYTVEGLTVSYYRRAVAAADTLMQMGRWFGFRRNYEDLVRLFIGRGEGNAGKKALDLYAAFRAVCLDEEEFRGELRRYASMREPRVTPRMVPPLVPSHMLRPTAANKMFNACVVSENFGGRWCDKTNAPTLRRDMVSNERIARGLLGRGDLRKLRLAAVTDGRERAVSAAVGVRTPREVCRFLQAYRWSGSNQALLARHLDFLRGVHGDTRIKRWLVIAPMQEVRGTDGWSVGRVEIDVRHRARVTAERYNVYTEPAHKALAEYLCALCDGTAVSPDALRLRSDTQGVLLVYPVRDKELEKGGVSIGFAALFPRNGISASLRFGVADKDNPDAVTTASPR